MSNFKLKIDGLTQLTKWLNESQDATRVVPDVVATIMQFNAAMDKRVGEVFTCIHSLESVRIGKSLADNIGTLSRFSLQYRDVPVPLSDFKFTLTPSEVESKAPIRMGADPLSFVKWTKGKYSQQVNIQVQTGKTVLGIRGSQLAYLAPNGMLRARIGEATWNEFPTFGSLGDRTGMTKGLFGPSLASQARGVYENDNYIANAREKMETAIINSFIKFYSR